MRQVLRQLLAQAATAATELHRLFLAAALPMLVVVAAVEIQTPHHLPTVLEALAGVATLEHQQLLELLILAVAAEVAKVVQLYTTAKQAATVS